MRKSTRISTNGGAFYFSLSVGSVAYALNNINLVKGIKQASPFAQTSCLEGFHSVLNHFSPKMIAFSYAGMYCGCEFLSLSDQ